MAQVPSHHVEGIAVFAAAAGRTDGHGAAIERVRVQNSIVVADLVRGDVDREGLVDPDASASDAREPGPAAGDRREDVDRRVVIGGGKPGGRGRVVRQTGDLPDV